MSCAVGRRQIPHADRRRDRRARPADDGARGARRAAVHRARHDRRRRAARVSPVYFTPDRFVDLYWVSHPDTHHSANLARDSRVTGVVYDSTLAPGQGRAVYVDGRAREIPADELEAHCPVAFDPARWPRLRPPRDRGDADLRLWLLHVESWEVHIPAGHPTLGTGRDRRVPIDPVQPIRSSPHSGHRVQHDRKERPALGYGGHAVSMGGHRTPPTVAALLQGSPSGGRRGAGAISRGNDAPTRRFTASELAPCCAVTAACGRADEATPHRPPPPPARSTRQR